jgi:O-antigen/teichoic acid export membrane protein
VPRSVLEGQNMGYKRMGLSATLVFVGGGLLALAAKLNTGLVGVAASRLATTALTGLLFFQIVRSYVPWFGVAKPEFGAVRRFLGLSGWFLFWNMVMKLMTASDVVVLGVLDSAELVTTYTLAKYVPETIINSVAIVVFGITPGLGGIIGSGDLGRATRVRSEIMAFSWLVVTALGSTISMWNSAFVRLWVGPEYALGPLPTLLIILMVMQFIIIRNDANIIDLTLNLRRKVLIGFLSAGISLALAAILVGHFKTGIVGMCIGFLAGRLVLTVAYPWLVGRHLEIQFGSQIRSAIRPALVAGLLFGLSATLQRYVAVNTWYGLILGTGVTLTVVSLVAVFSGLSRRQRDQLWERGREVLRLRT